ncbi:MAG: hypothetical protein VXX37_01750 [Pseudomonadota bacterium]|nr:hypothetical protein [Pseudomonadota bacterium]
MFANGMAELMKMVREGKIASIDIQERQLSEAGAALAYLEQGKANDRRILISD